MKTNEQGEVWLDKVQAYVCPSYLNNNSTDFSDINSEWLYNLYQKHFPNAEDNAIKSQIKNEVFNLIGKDNYKKKNLIKALRNKFPDIKSGVICRILKKFLSLRVLEIDLTYKTKPFVIKGKYYIN
jgi:hypothetical protein|tara:strand:+ start:37 stop:414 length:378 start_codon:yes stop_codon:yes gene_type:complete